MQRHDVNMQSFRYSSHLQGAREAATGPDATSHHAQGLPSRLRYLRPKTLSRIHRVLSHCKGLWKCARTHCKTVASLAERAVAARPSFSSASSSCVATSSRLLVRLTSCARRPSSAALLRLKASSTALLFASLSAWNDKASRYYITIQRDEDIAVRKFAQRAELFTHT